MITANLILLSALKSYLIVGLICCAILPRARQSIVSSINPNGLRDHSAWTVAFYCTGVAAITLIGWPSVLHGAYLTPRQD